jgi:hypothetical protein
MMKIRDKGTPMQRKIMLRVESHDMARLDQIQQACNLVGADHPPTDAVASRRGEDPQEWERIIKVFGRLRGNDFTLEDAIEAVAIIRRRRDELVNQAEPVFDNPMQDKVWKDGIRANSNQAVRMAEQFLADLNEDINVSILLMGGAT